MRKMQNTIKIKKQNSQQAIVDRAEKTIGENTIFGGVKKGFNVRQAAEFNVAKNQFFSIKSKKPVGLGFTRRISKNPRLAKTLSEKAWKQYKSSLPLLEALEKAMENRNVPIKQVIGMCFKFLSETHRGALDFVFDAKSYQNTIRLHLKPEHRKSSKRDIINSIMPSNGLDNVLSHRRRLLLNIACELGRKSSHPSTDAFRDYTWDWYRRNYVPLKKRINIFTETEEVQRKELEAFKKKNRIKSFKDAFNALKDLNKEIIIRKLKRKEVVANLIKRATPKGKQIIRALTHFAGEAISIDEIMHTTNSKAFVLMLMAAEKRKISVGEFKQILIETIYRKGKISDFL